MRFQPLLGIALGLLFANCAIPIHGQTSISSKAPLSYITDPQAPLGSEKHPARVSSGVMASHTITQPKPVYPPFPPETKIGGATVIRVLIDPEGKVARAESISGPEALREGAIEAIRKWTYKPFLLDGVPAWVETIVTLNF